MCQRGGEQCCPCAQQSPACTEAHGSVGAAFPPHTAVPRLGSRSLQGQKEYPGKQAKEKRGKQRLVPIQPATPPKAEEESQAGHTEKSRRMNGHVEYMFSKVCKVLPLARLTHSGIINELFSICILPPTTLSLAFSFFFRPICVHVLLPIAESGAGKVHLDGKDICIPEHSVAVVIVLGHRGHKTLELEHDVLHCSGDRLGGKMCENSLPKQYEGCDQSSLTSVRYYFLHIDPFCPLRADVSGTATKEFFSKEELSLLS